jgi:hypothetical protein
MTLSCPRLFEVEALRNGRLAGAERNLFERHLTTCAVCAHEARELGALGAALRLSHRTETDELRARRERTRLLAAFDRALISRTPPKTRGRPFAIAMAAVVLAAVLLIWRSFSAAPVAVSRALIHEGPATVWSRRTADRRDVVVLERGELRIQVTHADGKLPLLVLLPDGELEDTGTIFSVTVEGSRTTRVAVLEGSVRLRIRAKPAIEIRAGETWSAASPPRIPGSAASRVEPAPSGDRSANAEPSPSARQGSPVRSASPSPSATASAFEPSDGPSEEFRAAVGSFNRGENAEAARRFALFLAEHPRDARAEDAAYLRVLSLRRAGEASAMKSGALEYLRRFPAGFRRAEVESLAR